MFPLTRLTILSLADQVNLTFILYTGSLVKCLWLSKMQFICPEIKRIQDDEKKSIFRSSDPYLLHLGGNTYILKALLIYFLLLMIS